MLRHKNIDRVCCIALALTLLVSTLFVGAAATGLITENATIGYETRLFDQSRVHTIDIVMDDWEAFLDTATSEEYAACHLVIDGESFKNVAIRGKGNTSLSSVQAYGNNRYSFKVEFDHYQSGATYHGLDKLSLNNLIQDNTYMKDYFAYTLMNKMGVAAPLCSFVQINVNGEPWGLYLAVEGVEDAFLQRNYGKDHGELYKPDSMSLGGGRGNGRDFDMEEMAEKFGISFDSTGEGEQQLFTPPEGFEMPALPEGMDPSWMEGFGRNMEQQTATAAPMATPEGMEIPDASGSMPQMPAGGAMPDMGGIPQMPEGGTMPDMGSMPQMPEGGAMPDMGSMPQMPTNGETSDAENQAESANATRWNRNAAPDRNFGGMNGSTDVKLQYTDDDPASYTNIFDNAKTDVTAADQTRLIASLKALGEGDASVVDTDAVIRYMAVHNFLCNDDSYTGNIIHNYYLYEEDGVLAMIPWDYNLAYASMTGSNATSAVNTDIDRLVTSGSDSDRPMAGWITASEEYMAQYHAIYQEFMTTVFDSGWFAAEIDRVTAMIDPYVQRDTTAFCTYEEFLTGAETLKQFCLKRAQSVTNQLNGVETRVDASELTLSAMGTMNGRGGMGGDRGGFAKTDRSFGAQGQNRSPSATQGVVQTDVKPEATAETAGASSGQALSPKAAEESVAGEPRTRSINFNSVDAPGDSTQPQGWVWIAVCVALLCAALAVAGFYQSKR